MKQFIGLMVFLFIGSGCTLSSVDRVQQTIEAQAKLLVDSGYIEKRYVVFEDYVFTDSHRIYVIGDADCPLDVDFLGCPSKIVTYKDKFLCFANHDEPELSIDEVKKITSYSGNPLNDCFNSIKWVMVISNQGEVKRIIDYEEVMGDTFLAWTDLWPYFYGYESHCPVQMILGSHNVKVDLGNSISYNVDSLNLRQRLLKDMSYIYGEMFLQNNTDSVVCLSSDTKKHYAIANGRDTLYLSLCDSLPIVLAPHRYMYCSYQSIPNEHFFKKLSLEKDPWGYFHRLFSNSAYSLMDIDHQKTVTRIMHINGTWFDVRDEHNSNLFRILDPDMKRDRNPLCKQRYWEKQLEENQ